MLTNKTVYGIIAMIELSKSGQTPIKLKTIVDNQKLPKAFMDHIFAVLKKNRLVRVQKGPGGGYVLAKTPESTTVWEIVKAIGDLDTHSEPLTDTKEAESVHNMVSDLNVNVASFFEIPLSELLKE